LSRLLKYCLDLMSLRYCIRRLRNLRLEYIMERDGGRREEILREIVECLEQARRILEEIRRMWG